MVGGRQALKPDDSSAAGTPLVWSPTVRVVRLAFSTLIAGSFVVLGASAVSAQTTTTMPPVRSIPVTGGQTATTTTAPEGGGDSVTAGASGDLADTGIAADMLVPFGFALIGGGAVLQAAARRRPRNAYGLL